MFASIPNYTTHHRIVYKKEYKRTLVNTWNVGNNRDNLEGIMICLRCRQETLLMTNGKPRCRKCRIAVNELKARLAEERKQKARDIKEVTHGEDRSGLHRLRENTDSDKDESREEMQGVLHKASEVDEQSE
jgi:hypothetical protein